MRSPPTPRSSRPWSEPRSPRPCCGAAARLRRLLAALPEGEAGVAPAEVDKAALEGLQAKDDTAKGGAVGRLEVQTPSGLGRVADAMVAAYDWVAERVNRLLEWLKKLWPKSARRASPSGGASVGAIAVVVAAALLLGILTWRTVRRGAAAPVEVESEGAAPARDDDPLSRETTQWEARARELAAAGRWREAVRAFYHAVLVALFEAGLLHYQRGRTNWEYAAALSPQLTCAPPSSTSPASSTASGTAAGRATPKRSAPAPRPPAASCAPRGRVA